jgi:hypothetical protein
MSSNLRDPKATDREQPERSGLDPDELRAEQAGDLPARDAMSIVSVGGLEGGLPPAELLDDVVGSDVPVTTLPVDDLPVEHYPVDRLPIDRLPVDPLLPVEPPVHTLRVEEPIRPPIDTLPIEPPIDTWPTEPPAESDPIGVPDRLDGSADASVKA